MHTRRARKTISFSIAVLVFAGAELLATRRPAFASPRTWQPLIVKGAQVSQLCKRPISQLEVFAMRGASIEPIPFQVDQVNPDVSYALSEGPEPKASVHPGVLDTRDEIAMMIADLGERATPNASIPPGALEIEMTDPLGGHNLYAYIAIDRKSVV